MLDADRVACGALLLPLAPQPCPCVIELNGSKVGLNCASSDGDEPEMGRAVNGSELDKPWHRPGALAYARGRVRGIFRPSVSAYEPPDVTLCSEVDVPIPMPDGTILRANVYLPPGAGKFPVILCTHPYGKDKLPRRGTRAWKFSPQYRVMRQGRPV